MAEPELDHHQIKPNDKVLIVASDGIFEFITTRGCLDMALLYNNPLEACLALVGESYKLWIEREDRTDDITIIVGFIEQSGAKRDPGVGIEEVAIEEGTAEMKKKKTRRGSLGGKARSRGAPVSLSIKTATLEAGSGSGTRGQLQRGVIIILQRDGTGGLRRLLQKAASRLLQRSHRGIHHYQRAIPSPSSIASSASTTPINNTNFVASLRV